MAQPNQSEIPAPPDAPAPAPPHDPRREQRLCTMFRTGKLSWADGETICRVRNISPNGFMADVCPAPARGATVWLGLDEERRYEARVVWTQGDRFGAQFAAEQSISDLLNPADRDPRRRHRAPRLEPRCASVTLAQDGRTMRASILNISQSGMAVFASGVALSRGTRGMLRIDIDGLDPMTGFLCWSGQDTAGIQFAEPLSFETLSHWLWAVTLATQGRGGGEP